MPIFGVVDESRDLPSIDGFDFYLFTVKIYASPEDMGVYSTETIAEFVADKWCFVSVYGVCQKDGQVFGIQRLTVAEHGEMAGKPVNAFDKALATGMIDSLRDRAVALFKSWELA